MYRRKKCRASNRKKPQATRMYSQVHDITVASLLFEPENGGPESGGARARKPRRDGLQQRQVREHGEEHPNSVGQGIAAEHSAERQKEHALAERPPGSLRGRLKQRPEQAVPSVCLVRQVQPDEVILLEPCQQARPVQDQAEDRRNCPVGGDEEFPSQRKIITRGGAVARVARRAGRKERSAQWWRNHSG